MIKKSDLQEVVALQARNLIQEQDWILRDILPLLPLNIESHALIISGVRRCGKSTVLRQLLYNQLDNVFFLNFDTPKLFNFEIDDFSILDEIIREQGKKILLFDEIQSVKGWELFIRQKLDDRFRVFITGSNASLLSRELGTKLTGRHITKELFPFSFSEFCRFKKLNTDANSLAEYLNSGGFPEYLKTNNQEILVHLINDIVYRDISVRYNIRDVSLAKQLLIYLASNVAKPTSATRLTQVLPIKSPVTILDYFSFFEQTYLLQLIPKFSYSVRAQMVNPKKVYFLDNGLVNALSVSFSSDFGRKLENAVFAELRKKHLEIYYFSEKGKECDFVVFENQKPIHLIQVCYQINSDNEAREKSGLLAAMGFFNLKKGTIITFDQNDKWILTDKTVNVVPFYNYFSK